MLPLESVARPTERKAAKTVVAIDSAVVRFAGDSGDGMQLVGEQFTTTSALMNENIATLPDYPSEIRAPAGSVSGVSGYQLCFGSADVFTPGSKLDVLVAMNPAALKVNLRHLREGATIIVNSDAFSPRNLAKAEIVGNPLEDGSLKGYAVVQVPIAAATQAALLAGELGSKHVDRSKNFFALGVTYWLFQRDRTHTLHWLQKKFAGKPDALAANILALQAGWNFGEASPDLPRCYEMTDRKEARGPGIYRSVSGNVATALGLLAAARKAELQLFLGSYPITPATDILHTLCKYPEHVRVVQAEDEIAAIGTALGASFGGALGTTTTSGPGFSLKSEFINLAVMVELPLVIVNVQRAGPSTGMPTKTEQADLLQALFGRHGESPLVVLAASSPRDCFDAAVEASRIALKYMTPVILLTDGYLGNGTEVWRVPDLAELPDMTVTKRTHGDEFLPYERDEHTLARDWVVPGTTGLEYRIGGLEKEDGTGTISHDARNHEKMVHLRAAKIAGVAQDIPPLEIFGDPKADLLVLGWGSTQGVIRQVVQKLNRQGIPVAATHLRHISPLPSDLLEVASRFKRVLLPEMNSGQLWYHLRGKLLLDCELLSKVQGQPFSPEEIETKILSML